MSPNSPFDALLLENLKSIQGSIKDLRDEQSEMKSDLGTRLTAVEVKMTSLKQGMVPFKEQVRKEARRWGAVGGVGATAVGLVAALMKLSFFPDK